MLKSVIYSLQTPHLIPFEEIVSYGYDGKVTIIAEASVSENIDVSELNMSGKLLVDMFGCAMCAARYDDWRKAICRRKHY